MSLSGSSSARDNSRLGKDHDKDEKEVLFSNNENHFFVIQAKV